ncbi:MAG: hypothetical protein WA947_07500, partial [Phormidesmis sp.]
VQISCVKICLYLAVEGFELLEGNEVFNFGVGPFCIGVLGASEPVSARRFSHKFRVLRLIFSVLLM